MVLTGKLKAFADAVLGGFSHKNAAIEAGYSAKTAAPAGSRLAKDPRVVAYLIAHRSAKQSAPPAPAAPAAPASGTNQDAPPEGNPFDLNIAILHSDPKAFLLAAMNDSLIEPKLRIDAAKALMPFTHAKLGEGGKKEQKEEAAKKVAARFSAGAPPKLVATGGKKI